MTKSRAQFAPMVTMNRPITKKGIKMMVGKAEDEHEDREEGEATEEWIEWIRKWMDQPANTPEQG